MRNEMSILVSGAKAADAKGSTNADMRAFKKM
jgi:hypothetical protein